MNKYDLAVILAALGKSNKRISTMGAELTALKSLPLPEGKPGKSGADGERGEVGPAGPQGEQGPMGPTGPKGERGERGPKGEQGPMGPIGPKGDQGATGPKGERGDTGPMGPTGAKGERGESGKAGRIPRHQIKNGEIAFELRPGVYGEWIKFQQTNQYISGGAYTKPIVTKSADYTVKLSDHTVLCDASTARVVITLPTARSSEGYIFNIKKIDTTANRVSIVAANGDAIDGNGSVHVETPHMALNLHSNGTNWYII